MLKSYPPLAPSLSHTTHPHLAFPNLNVRVCKKKNKTCGSPRYSVKKRTLTENYPTTKSTNMQIESGWKWKCDRWRWTLKKYIFVFPIKSEKSQRNPYHHREAEKTWTTEQLQNQGPRSLINQQTCQGSFSAESKPAMFNSFSGNLQHVYMSSLENEILLTCACIYNLSPRLLQ